MRLLIDSHVPAALAQQLQRHGVEAVHLAIWQGGSHLNAPDDRILSAAYRDARVLLTFDCETVAALTREWLKIERHHAGVILVPGRTFRPNDIGKMLRALLGLIEEFGDNPWDDLVLFLRPR